MQAVSLFAGIGGFDLALRNNGVDVTLQSELDPKCRETLGRHFPGVDIIPDVRDVTGPNLPIPHIVVGGFPCQDISVAGRRAGLAGERSGLWYEYARILDELRPDWCIIENVAGLLSSNQGRDLGAILGTLAEIGYGFAYRVLDAQFFGVPQRRRRVFIVGRFGDAERAGRVLLESEGGNWNPPPRRETRQEDPDAATAGARSTRWCPDVDVPVLSNTRGGQRTTDLDGVNYIIDDLPPATYSIYPESGQGTDLVARETDLAPTLTSNTSGMIGGDRGCFVAHKPTPLYYSHDYNQDRVYAAEGISEALTVARRPNFFTMGGVRRLMPIECERLQGFPDGWTEGHPTTQRYKMLGNAVAVPVVDWIVRRLMAVA